MSNRNSKYYQELKTAGISSEQDRIIRSELEDDNSHYIPPPSPHDQAESTSMGMDPQSAYRYQDLSVLQSITGLNQPYASNIRSIDELLERDNQREKDGFPRKIRIGRLIKPGKGKKDKVVVVPTTVEEKLIHDKIRAQEEEEASGGTGDGEEGEVIGEQPIHDPNGSGSGPGEGDGGQHDLESSAYDLGKILTDKFELPNLKDKGKKHSLTRYTYDLTDKHQGFGQLLDKKATLRKIIETNITLGNIPDRSNIDSTGFLIAPSDRIYRVLSREKDYESQAMVFFLRDYSGSMAGKSTEQIVAQHVLIYSWLIYQYARQVESRFILHDTEAKEVPDFYAYYNSSVAGGTRVASAFHLVNEIVEKENLIQDYNIYVFHGTDGDDWDTDGKEAIPEIKKMLTYSNRVGVTIAEHGSGTGRSSEVERYIKGSGLLTEKKELIRLDVMKEDADETRLIEGIKNLISE
ncbi:MAG: DUF444 family protein [Deltaproteobacteria bacterium]|nr:DUF444 family protein [Deltaproteobacteria bacterium]